MLLKTADSKEKDISVLTALAERPNLASKTKVLIEQEIRNIKAGLAGERAAIFELNSIFKPTSRNWMIIHDLRVQHAGLVAQIDHVLINRFLEVYVLESKHVSEGIAVNEQGEFTSFYNGKPRGMASPVEQNARHIRVLEALFESEAITLPRRLGVRLRPSFYNVVLVSNTARIARPKKAVPGLDSLLKVEKLAKFLESKSESGNMLKVIGQDTLEILGRELALCHKPLDFNWPAKFGLSAESEPRAEVPVALSVQPRSDDCVPPPASADAEKAVPSGPGPDRAVLLEADTAPAGNSSKKKLVCCGCGCALPFAVARFCWSQPNKYGGDAYCRTCQDSRRER